MSNCSQCGHLKTDHVHRPDSDKVLCWLCGCDAVSREEGSEYGQVPDADKLRL